MPTSTILLTILALINIFAFITIANDKSKSIRGGTTERTPEGIFFFLAALFGSIGVFLGMHVFRHKTRKWYFQIGIPLLIAQNLATLMIVKEFLNL